MSIQDENGEIVTLGAIHAAVFRFVIWAAALAIPAGVVATWHVLRTVDNHEWRIALLERSSARGGVSQNVNVGALDGVAKDDSARVFLTVQEVAQREGVTDRTILNWIDEGRVQPAPMKEGKSWVIAENFRILPQIAAQQPKPKTTP